MLFGKVRIMTSVSWCGGFWLTIRNIFSSYLLRSVVDILWAHIWEGHCAEFSASDVFPFFDFWAKNDYRTYLLFSERSCFVASRSDGEFYGVVSVPRSRSRWGVACGISKARADVRLFCWWWWSWFFVVLGCVAHVGVLRCSLLLLLLIWLSCC